MQLMGIIYMSEPLLLKSLTPSLPGSNGKSFISAAELMLRFEVKSPTLRQAPATDRTHTSAHRQPNTPRTAKNIPPLLPKRQSAQLAPQMLREIKLTTPRNTSKIETKARETIKPAQNAMKKPKTDKRPDKDKQGQDRGTVVKLMKAINRRNTQTKSQKPSKQNKENQPVKMEKLPLFKIRRSEEYPLSDRLPPNDTHQRSKTIRTTLCLESDSKSLINSIHSVRHTHQPRYFRKSITASTVSLQTGNAFEDEGDLLFSKHTASTMLPATVRQQDMSTQLQMTKKRIYQQIYALDKKLLGEDTGERKGVVICLKRKAKEDKDA